MIDVCDKGIFIKKDKIIGEGSLGPVYEACKLDCGYIVKELSLHYETTKETVARQYGLTAPFEILSCPEQKKKYFIQKKLQGTLTQLLVKQDNTLTPNQFQKLHKLLIKLLLHARIFHNDLHSDNIMYRGNKFYLIDFDLAKFIHDYGYRYFDRKLKENCSIENLNTGKHIPILSHEDLDLIKERVRPSIQQTEMQRQERQRLQAKMQKIKNKKS